MSITDWILLSDVLNWNFKLKINKSVFHLKKKLKYNRRTNVQENMRIETHKRILIPSLLSQFFNFPFFMRLFNYWTFLIDIYVFFSFAYLFSIFFSFLKIYLGYCMKYTLVWIMNRACACCTSWSKSISSRPLVNIFCIFRS